MSAFDGIMLFLNLLIIFCIFFYALFTDHPHALVIWHATAVFGVLITAVRHFGIQRTKRDEE